MTKETKIPDWAHERMGRVLAVSLFALNEQRCHIAKYLSSEDPAMSHLRQAALHMEQARAALAEQMGDSQTSDEAINTYYQPVISYMITNTSAVFDPDDAEAAQEWAETILSDEATLDIDVSE